MDPTDPAWFYSTLAQTSAAIVGLIGAVLGSRILDRVGPLHKSQEELKSEINDQYQGLRQQRDKLSEYVAFYSGRSRRTTLRSGTVGHGAL